MRHSTRLKNDETTTNTRTARLLTRTVKSVGDVFIFLVRWRLLR
jgi:hypothetical protein